MYLPGPSRDASMRRAAILVVLLSLLLSLLAACGGSAPSDGSAFLSARPLAARPTPAGAAKVKPTPTGAAVTGQGAPGGSALVYLDPGHGGVDFGATSTTPDGAPVAEKNLTLLIAKQTAARLRADGISVVLSRDDDSLPGSQPSDYTPDGKLLTPEGVLNDLQRRIDRANQSGALVLVSIHLNAFSDPAVGGSETFYDSARPFGGENEKLARLVQSNLVSSLRTRGIVAADRGVTDDSTLVAEAFGTLGASYSHLVLLGPAVPGKLHPSQMPGVLSEPMFISNPREASELVLPSTQAALADAYAKAIEEFLRSNQ